MIDSLTSLGNKISKQLPSLKNIDQTAQRNYLEEGYLQNNFNDESAKLNQILIQQPQATVIFRKKMYTSIANNYVSKSMSEDERLYMSTMDRLFYNKCKQIRAYEMLCKIEKASDRVGEIDEQIMPIIIGLSDMLSSTMSAFGKESNPLGSFGEITRKIKSVLTYSSSNFYTTWIEDIVTPPSLKFGTGTGAIEFTNFTRVTAGSTIKGQASFSVSFDDPYELMTITPYDVETAISDVVDPKPLNVINMGSETYQSLIDSNIQKLNGIRESRGASRIQFNINPNAIIGRKIIAIVEATGQEIPFEEPTWGLPLFNLSSINVSKEYLRGGEVLGEQGLSDTQTKNPFGVSLSKSNLLATSELSAFKDAANAIINKINFDKNSISKYDFSKATKQIDNIRKKLIFYYAGKNIIQPMDTVNIFISSKSKYDTKIMSGMKNAFEGFGLFSNFSNQLTQLSSSWNAIFSPANIENQIEKTTFGAENLPDYIWNMFRKNYTSEKEGCHVFAGLVERVSSSYSDGAFNVSVEGKDNTEYLNQSFVNFKPGANANAGIFYEPLTPFKSTFDSVYNLRKIGKNGYLDENRDNLKNLGLKAPEGIAAGRSFGDEELPSEVVYTRTGTNPYGKKVIYAPDGLVYKWKEGIGTYSLSGSSDDINSEEHNGAFSATSHILANQDIMNAVSLMVTGTPYNYYNYYKAGIESGALVSNQNSKNPPTSPALTTSALSNFIEKTIKNNAMWGDFIPFKGIKVGKQDMIEKMSLKSSKIIESQNNINKNLKELDDLRTKVSIIALMSKNDKDQNLFQNDSILKDQLANLSKLSENIGTQEQEAMKLMDDTNFSIIGNDIHEDYDFYFNNGMSAENSLSRRQVTKKANFLTRKLSWAVRSNVDQNYFIVDDSYDKNMDLLAFEGDIAGQKMSLFNNEYTKVLDKVTGAVSLLGMEFFADSQGNLRVRAPQYNRIPSSVLLTMVRNKYLKKTGYVFPEFLTNLLFNQIAVLSNEISIIENKIRYLALILGKEDDNSIINYLKSSTQISSPDKKEFCFLTNEDGEIVAIKDVLNPKEDENEDDRRARFSTLKEISNGVGGASVIKEQLNIKNTFDITSVARRTKNDIDEIIKNQKISSNEYKSKLDSNKEKLEFLAKEVSKKSGGTERLKISDWVTYPATGNESGTIFGGVVFPAVYKPNQYAIDQKMAELLSSRQKAVKQLYYAIKNSYEFNSLNEDDTAIKLLNPALVGPNEELPEVFDHLIEDESYDDYGPGSGSRYIIKNAQIRSYRINENSPEFTAVSVVGRIAKNFPNSQADIGMQDLPGNGNGIVESSAIDYDLWRMYGLKQNFKLDKPFLTNASTQTEPFAVSLLMNQRKNLIRGSVTISGNEYMQPGEVIYLEQKGMLFYVESVTHSITLGSEFTTDLTLSYGHYPGEYIPTQLDVAGKMLYANRDKYDVEVRRDIVTQSGDKAGVLIMFDKDNPTENFKSSNDFAKQNCQTIQSIANKLYSEIVKESSSKKKTILNIFIYKDSRVSGTNETEGFAKEIINILLGKSTYSAMDPKFAKRFTENNFTYKTSDGQQASTIRLIDLGDKNTSHSPSGEAIYAANSLLDPKAPIQKRDEVVGASSTLANTAEGKYAIKNIYLTRYIVDCFVKSYFE